MNRLFLVFIALAIFAASLGAVSVGTIEVSIKDLESSKGKVYVHLFNSKNPDAFPTKMKKRLKMQLVGINKQKATAVFKNVPYGVYAVVAHHDENLSQLMDRNFLGMPSEGFGFSLNPTVVTGPPEFSESKFKLSKKVKKIVIEMTNLP